jgi:hypothetical protein
MKKEESETNCILRSFIICSLLQIILGDSRAEGGARRIYGEMGNCTKLCSENLRGRNYSE